MDIKQAAQAERETLTMDDILPLYGYQKNRQGFICCPFHGEKTASLKIYHGTGGWHCFGCGMGGSIIDFVMAHENCNFPTAVKAIDQALNLNLTAPPDPFSFRQQARLQETLDHFVDAVYAYCDALIQYHEAEQIRDYKKYVALDALRNGNIQQLTADDWTFLLSWKDNDLYTDYLKEKIYNFKEGVAAWRREHRKDKK